MFLAGGEAQLEDGALAVGQQDAGGNPSRPKVPSCERGVKQPRRVLLPAVRFHDHPRNPEGLRVVRVGEREPAREQDETRAPPCAPEAGGEGAPPPGHAVRVHYDQVGREVVQPGDGLAQVGELAHRDAQRRERLRDGLADEVGCCLDDDLQGHACSRVPLG
jgi:hypothetical protein